MSDSFDRAWGEVHKSAFREGRERRRAEAYARIPEMYRRFVDQDAMRQPPAPARRRMAPRRQRATASPPTQRRRPVRRRGLDERVMQERMDAIDAETATSMDRNDPMYGREPTATLTPRRVMMPSPEQSTPLPEPGETRGKLSPEETAMGRALIEAIRESGFGQPEEPQPPSIETPASEVIEPTEEVQEKVNKPLDDDMRSLRPSTDLYDRFSNQAIQEATPTVSDEREAFHETKEHRYPLSRANSPKPPTERETRIEELKDMEAEQPTRMAPKGKGGQKIDKPASKTMTMKDLVKPKKEDKPKEAESEVPRLGSRPEDEDVMKVIEMVQNGNAKAKTELYGAMGDLEDMGSSLLDEAQEALDDYKAAEKQRRAERRKTESAKRKEAQGRTDNLSKPLTEAKEKGKMTNEDIARRLVGNRD